MSLDRWRRMAFPHRVLTIANDMNRAKNRIACGDLDSAIRAYERVLDLTDLAITLADRRPLRRELLRWRDLVAALYLQSTPDSEQHRDAQRALLLLSPASAPQTEFL